MSLVVTEGLSRALPSRPTTAHHVPGWPTCGRVVDVSAGAGGKALRCHLAHGHRGGCDDLGASALSHWQASTPEPPSQAATLEGVKTLALAQARTYEAVGHWKRERGANAEAEQLMAMADALRRLVLVMDR